MKTTSNTTIESVTVLEKTNGAPSKIEVKYAGQSPVIVDDNELVSLIMLFWVASIVRPQSKFNAAVNA